MNKNNYNFDIIIPILEKTVKELDAPIVTRIKKEDNDPFKILIGTILSLRTKDKTTDEASKRLFAAAKRLRKWQNFQLKKSRNLFIR